MNLLTQPIGVSHYLVVGAIMFVTGAVCMATKRNALGVLMGIELVLNGANVNFVTSTGIFGGMTHRERREWARSETFDIVDRSYTLQRTRQPSTR
jgi:multisubunit Na+/H+ antiporter MnhC subunit